MDDPRIARRAFLRSLLAAGAGVVSAPALASTAEAADRRWRRGNWGWRGVPLRRWGWASRRYYAPRGYYVPGPVYAPAPPVYVAPRRPGFWFQTGPRPLPGYYPPML
jgi:hypothetical protein